MKELNPRYFVICSALMLAVSTYTFSTSIGLPYIFILTSILLLISLFLPFRIKYNDRSVIYSMLISLTFAVIFDLLFPMERDKFMLVGELLYINISAPFLIYFCAFITFFKFNVHIPGLVSAISIVVLLLTTDIQKGGDTVSKLPFFSYSEKTQDKLFVLVIFVQIILLLVVTSYSKPAFSKKFRTGTFFPKMALILLSLGISAGMMFFFMKFYNVFESNIRNLEGFMFKYGTRGARLGTSYMSSRNIDLRKSMKQNNNKTEKQIIVRAISNNPPGYLRGRAYDIYNDGNWLLAQNPKTNMNSQSYEGILVYRTFFFGNRPLQYPIKIDFMYAGDFKTDILLVPGNYEQIELVAERLGWNDNGTLSPEDWEKDGGYTVFAKENNENAAFNIKEIPPSGHPLYLDIPESVIPIIDKFKEEIFPHNKANFALNDSEKINKIKDYFTSQYRYSLDFEMNPKDKDPLESFLRAKKGHCELFASSAALLARRFGMPARYITGFLCFEKHPIGNYYVSRLDNAHAWAEVYLRNEKRWVLLEATPEGGIPFKSSSGDWGFFQSYSDYFYKVMQSVLTNIRRGFFAKAVLTILISTYEIIRDVIWHPLRGPLLLIAFLLGFLLKKMLRRRQRRSRWKIPEETLNLVDEFSIFERKLSTVSGLTRETSETASEWISRVNKKFPRLSCPLREFLERYQDTRFSIALPRKEQISAVRKLRKKFPWKDISSQLQNSAET
jgi:hypothetical protein